MYLYLFGHLQDECCAGDFGMIQKNGAFMLIHDLLHRTQADAFGLGLGREKQMEDP
jgi:hypothetical protein